MELWRLSCCRMRTWIAWAPRASSWYKSWSSRSQYLRILWLDFKKIDLCVPKNSIWSREIMSQKWLNSRSGFRNRRTSTNRYPMTTSTTSMRLETLSSAWMTNFNLLASKMRLSNSRWTRLSKQKMLKATTKRIYMLRRLNNLPHASGRAQRRMSKS